MTDNSVIEAKLKVIEEIKNYLPIKDRDAFYDVYARKSLGELLFELSLFRGFQNRNGVESFRERPGIYPNKHKRF